MSVGARGLVRAIRGYQRWVSPAIGAVSGGGCRFHPSCSEYAILAIRSDGAVRGGGRALRRLLRCHPLATGGLDLP